MAFVHLHNRTQFSLLDGAMRPSELVARAVELGMGAVAVTDTCNLYGAIELHTATKEADIRPIYGAEIWVWPPGLANLDPRSGDGGWNLVLLVENPTGYHNLCRLITRAIFDGMHYRPRIDLDLLATHHAGLIALTGGLNGPIGTLRDTDEARTCIENLAQIMGEGQLFIELQDYGLPDQPACNDRARTIAQALGMPTVVTNASRYLTPTDAVTLDVLNAVGRGENLDDPARSALPTDQQYLKSEDEMRALFPDDGDAIDRTVDIADRCGFQFSTGTYHFPATTPPDPPTEDDTPDTDANWAYFCRTFPPPQVWGLPSADALPDRPSGAGNLNGYFEWYCHTGLEYRLTDIHEDQHTAYRERLVHELEIIERMGFPAYLVIVAEFINWAKDHEIPVGPGRGSAAGSIAAWAMRITDIDPIRFGLLFERFLNPERVSMPDIDVDFCQDRREEVIRHVRDKYGADMVSQIITFGNLKAKAALKDVARVCGVDFNQSNRIAKLIPDDPRLKMTLDKAMQEESFRDLALGDPMVGRIVSLAKHVEGMTRQTGVHAAGVVIADRPLVEHAPLYRDGPDGDPVVQFDMNSAETVGLIKFDFLGLKTLDQIRDALAMVARNTGENIDLGRIPLDDTQTFSMLQRGEGLGVFQVESSGMRDLLTRLRPSNIDDLIALIALYRPGPMQLIPQFIERKHGREEITYMHPDLGPILSETYGVIVYQEQVMQIAQVLAGYSLGEADLLRRAMGKKKKKEMERQKVRFLVGAKRRGLETKLADEIFELLAYFADYGFNKSHSAAYGIIAYQTAWLKTHHRAEFMAALMSIEASNTDKVLVYLGDCRHAGIKVLPPDVNQSLAGFDVPAEDRNQIRFGLAAVKGVGEGAVVAIREARDAAGGAFEDFTDCLERLDYTRVNKKVLESLIKCGAFDWTELPRCALFEGLLDAMAAAQQAQADAKSAQTALFGGAVAEAIRPRAQLPDVGEWPTAIKLGFEREALGFFITGHPVSAFADVVAQLATCNVSKLDDRAHDDEVAVAGVINAFRTGRTRRGDRMAFTTLQDAEGAVECVFFPEAYARSRRVLAAEQPVLVRGKVQKGDRRGNKTQDSGTAKIIAESAELLSELRQRRTRAVHLWITLDELDETRIANLDSLMQESPGTCPVHIHVHVSAGVWATLKVSEDLSVVPDDAFLQGLETLFRRSDVARLQ